MTTVYEAVKEAGFTGEAADVMTAIVLAESGGNAWAYNNTPPDDSYGLSQINMIGDLGSARRDEFGLENNDSLFDPHTNLRCAFRISNEGRDFNPWTTFTRGAYRDHLGKHDAEIVEHSQHGSPHTVKDSGGGKGGGHDGNGGPGRTYTVQEGDTLSEIASRYRIAGGWHTLYAANGRVIGDDPNLIKPGQVLVIPHGRNEQHTYTVQDGDSLSAIAQRFYGHADAWPALYHRNEDVIGDNPDLIKPGETLVIP